MEIKWEKMDYIAFILLGMLTIFYGNKQLQQLVALYRISHLVCLHHNIRS